MRVSASSNDPDYMHDVRFRVYLDGDLQEYVLSADEEEGCLCRAKLHDGIIELDSANDIITEILYGNVRLGQIDD